MTGTLVLPTSGTVSGLENNIDINAALAALATGSQGATAPTAGSTGLAATAGVLWHDTGAKALKMRNQADTSWITLLRLNETAGIAPAFGTSATGTAWTHFSANFTATAAQDGQWFWCDSSGLTVTLPLASSVSLGTMYLFSGEHQTLNFGTGSVAINHATPSSVSLAAGEFLGIQATESNWRVIVGSPRVLGAVMSVAGNTGDVTAAQLETAIGLSAYALTSALSAYAALSGATFSGAVHGPTASAGDNSTLLATTAFVANAIASLTAYAPLASPTFTGAPHAPTPATTDNSTAIATTAWVQNWYNAGSGVVGGGGGGSG